MRRAALAFVAILTTVATFAAEALARREGPPEWRAEWPRTDFTKHAVDFDEIVSGGPPRGGIPAIFDPHFAPLGDMTDLAETEPVVGLALGDDWRAYPLRILMRHEIVNDVVGGIPVAVTYCPLCNAAVVFDRRLDGRALEFNTTGKLRHSDLVMFDLETESWWQQFTGEAIVGELTGRKLEMLPARIESFARFRERARAAGHDDARVLIPNPGYGIFRAYGLNPYVGYERLSSPPLYDGDLPDGIAPLARIVVVGDDAWPLALVRERGSLRHDGLVITWTPGQRSVLDTADITAGTEIGNVVVQRETPDGLEDVVYDVSFAFAFHAFRPEGTIHRE